MTLYLPGIDPQEPEVLPACPPEQARRPRPRHRDDSLATLGSARATLNRLGVRHADWPHQKLLVVQVALRSYRFQPNRHAASLHEVVREGGAVRVVGSAWVGEEAILDHLWAERGREVELETRPLAPGRWKVLGWFDDGGRPVLAEDEPEVARRIAEGLAARSPGAGVR